jgi:hypothetical protein
VEKMAMSNRAGEEAMNELLRLLAREKVFDALDSETRRRVAAGVVKLCRHLGCGDWNVLDELGEYLEICPNCSEITVTFKNQVCPDCDRRIQEARVGWWNGGR